jgi:hypothetical protein
LCPLLKPHLYTPAPVPLLVLDPSVHQTTPPFLSGLNLFCHSHLSGTWLWMACGMHISEASCQTSSVEWVCAPYPEIFLVWPKLVNLGLHSCIHISL